MLENTETLDSRLNDFYNSKYNQGNKIFTVTDCSSSSNTSTNNNTNNNSIQVEENKSEENKDKPPRSDNKIKELFRNTINFAGNDINDILEEGNLKLKDNDLTNGFFYLSIKNKDLSKKKISELKKKH